MVAQCLQQRPEDRPTAAHLLRHKFFRLQPRDPEGLIRQLWASAAREPEEGASLPRAHGGLPVWARLMHHLPYQTASCQVNLPETSVRVIDCIVEESLSNELGCHGALQRRSGRGACTTCTAPAGSAARGPRMQVALPPTPCLLCCSKIVYVMTPAVSLRAVPFCATAELACGTLRPMCLLLLSMAKPFGFPDLGIGVCLGVDSNPHAQAGSELPDFFDGQHACALARRLLLLHSDEGAPQTLSDPDAAPMHDVLRACCAHSSLPWLLAAAISQCTVRPRPGSVRVWHECSAHASASMVAPRQLIGHPWISALLRFLL